MNSKPYRVEVTIRAPRDAVWRALTEPAQVREWFGWDYDGLDAEIQGIFVEYATPFPPDRIELESGDTIELADSGPHTILRVVKPGSLDGTEWSDIYDGMEEGWRTFFEQLRFRLERHPDGHRRTVFLTGTTTGPVILAALEPIAKESWHESKFQRMVVDGDGHLVEFAAHQPLDSEAASPASLTVTTYDLDDAGFAAVRDEWAERWRSFVQDAEVTT